MLFKVVYLVDTLQSVDVYEPKTLALWQVQIQKIKAAGLLKHRTYITRTLLNNNQFNQFIKNTGMRPQAHASIMPPHDLYIPFRYWFENPVICFHKDEENTLQTAFVMPIPEVAVPIYVYKLSAEDATKWMDNRFKRIKNAILNMYGYGY